MRKLSSSVQLCRSLTANRLLVTDAQQLEAASRRLLRAGQRQRYGSLQMRLLLRTLSIVSGTALLVSCAPSTQIQARAVQAQASCSSEQELLYFGDVMALAGSCRKQFPEMSAQVDRTVAELRAELPGCVSPFERAGKWQDMMRLAMEMGGPLQKNPHCTVDLEQGARRAVVGLKR